VYWCSRIHALMCILLECARTAISVHRSRSGRWMRRFYGHSWGDRQRKTSSLYRQILRLEWFVEESAQMVAYSGHLERDRSLRPQGPRCAHGYGFHGEHGLAVRLQQGKRHMFLKWKVCWQDDEIVYCNAMAEAITFWPTTSAKVNNYPTCF
jgi:hypothetical protein